VCPEGVDTASFLQALDWLDTWSSRLYEGQPIVAAVGFQRGDTQSDVFLGEVWAEDFGAVLTNAYDTMAIASYSGALIEYVSLPRPKVIPGYAPHRLAEIAEWTNDEAGRVALALNRSGDILVIRQGQLVFARRNGRWHFLSHEPVITQMGAPQDRDVRRAVYASCLDASFARTGACIGVLCSNDSAKLNRIAPEAGDHLMPAVSSKARALARAIKGRKFQEMDRRLRQELLAIDGATILDHEGRILAVGAILRVPGGSVGGGRRAAAIALSVYGVGIKVSQDGGIEGFHRSADGNTEKLAFRLMK